MIEYFASDERPAWQATVTIDGATEDLSTGHTFEVNIAPRHDPTVTALTKTQGITGSAEGVVTVQWEPDDLDLDPGGYLVQITVTRTSDSYEWTIQEALNIKQRFTPVP